MYSIRFWQSKTLVVVCIRHFVYTTQEEHWGDRLFQICIIAKLW